MTPAQLGAAVVTLVLFGISFLALELKERMRLTRRPSKSAVRNAMRRNASKTSNRSAKGSVRRLVLFVTGLNLMFTVLVKILKLANSGPADGPPAEGALAVDRAVHLLNRLSAHIPASIANEEVGDALEHIHRMAAEGQSPRSIYRKVARTFCWVIVHTVQHHVARLLPRVWGGA